MSIKLPVYSERPRRFFLHFLTEKKQHRINNVEVGRPDISPPNTMKYSNFRWTQRVDLHTSMGYKRQLRSRLLRKTSRPNAREKIRRNKNIQFSIYFSFFLSFLSQIAFLLITKKCAYIFFISGVCFEMKERKHITKHRSIINIF